MSADPEVQIEKLTGQSLFMVLASDGVFEFMNNQEVVDMVCLASAWLLPDIKPCRTLSAAAVAGSVLLGCATR